jgi:hypothetical protein
MQSIQVSDTIVVHLPSTFVSGSTADLIEAFGEPCESPLPRPAFGRCPECGSRRARLLQTTANVAVCRCARCGTVRRSRRSPL